jgi:hypothetical protein
VAWAASAGIATRSTRPLCDNQSLSLEKAMLWSPQRPPPRASRLSSTGHITPGERHSESFRSNGIDKPTYGIVAFLASGHGVFCTIRQISKGRATTRILPLCSSLFSIDKAAKRSDWFFTRHCFIIFGSGCIVIPLGSLSPLFFGVVPQPRARSFWISTSSPQTTRLVPGRACSGRIIIHKQLGRDSFE